jgi:hypothetical protein
MVIKARIMKTLNILFILILVISLSVSAQFKSQNPEKTSVANSLFRPSGTNSFLGFLNPENFQMNQNISMQYISGNGYGLSLASYTNSMFYKISNPLNVRLDVSLMGSPFGSYGMGNNTNFNKLFISRAEINYQPWENFHMQLQYRQLPISMYGYYTPYNWYTSPFNSGD